MPPMTVDDALALVSVDYACTADPDAHLSGQCYLFAKLHDISNDLVQVGAD